MGRAQRSLDVFNLSFLDVISCGFGAMILLLVLVLGLEPLVLDKIEAQSRNVVVEEDATSKQLTAEFEELQQEVAARTEALDQARQSLERLSAQWAALEAAAEDRQTQTTRQADIQKRLETVLQELTLEMQRLARQAEYRPPDPDAVIGGIPVDSEYIIFIVDTSGSMLKVAWPTVVRKVEEVLSVYPNVKGIQVLNDMGQYMFGTYAGRWIPDTPARRREVLKRLRTWNSYSNSSPVEGITHAVRHFLRKDRRISLYVFGDDFASGSINAVLNEVALHNRRGGMRVRIHTFGFPVLFTDPAYKDNRVRFAHLMRLLAEQNAGSFVGLTRLDPAAR